jgi:hypothetical protein
MTAPFKPTWLSPSAPGQLSNTRGTDIGADALVMQALYSNPLATGDQAGTMHVVATRVLHGGQQVNQPAWDAWAGNPTTSPLAPFIPVAPSAPVSTISVRFGNRIYVAEMSTGAITYWDYSQNPPRHITKSVFALQSMAISGGGVGSPRGENYIWVGSLSTATLVGLAVLTFNGIDHLYAMDSAGKIGWAPIKADGTLGNWTVYSGVGPTAAGVLLGGVLASNGTPWLVSIGGRPGAASTNVQQTSLNADGSIVGWSSTGVTQLPSACGRHAVWLDPDLAYIVVAGGDDNTTARSTVWSAPFNPLVSIGTWTASTNALPAARSAAAILVTSGFLFVIGGSSTNADTGGTNTVYSTAITAAGAITGAWTARTVLPVNLSRHTAFLTDGAGSLQTPYLAVTGGRTAVPADVYTVYESQDQGTGAIGGSWNSGVSNLVGAQLGSNGTVVNNPDGSQTITFSYGAFGATASLVGFSDGDLVQLEITFTDASAGDISPTEYTIVAIGQPPTISNITPTGATGNGKPLVQFNYSAVGGGASEAQWQVVITSGGQTYFDSGVVYDQSNNIQTNPAPLLPSGLTYTITVTVKSLDTPMAGSTNQAVLTTTFTPTYTPPAVPTPVSLVIDRVGGAAVLTWTNPVASTATLNRIWERQTGTSTWRLLKDNITAVIASPQSFTLMDDLSLIDSHDFAVSAIGPGPGESAKSSVVAGAIVPDYHFDLGGYTAMIHIVGNGPAQRAGLMLTAPPSFTTLIDADLSPAFAATGVVVRYGPMRYRQLHIEYTMDRDQVSSLRSALDAVLAAAQAGGIVCYRDRFNTVFYGGVMPSRQRSEDLYYEDQLDLAELAYAYSP